MMGMINHGGKIKIYKVSIPGIELAQDRR